MLNSSGSSSQRRQIFRSAFLAFACFTVLVSCQPVKQKQSITGIIGSWYGFYPLHYAKEIGIAEKYGVELRLVETGSALDLRRGYLRSTVDFMAISMVEVSNTFLLSNGEISLFLISDYSNGSDVILADKSLKSIQDLEGKRIGVDTYSVSMFVLKRALQKYELSKGFTHVVVGADDYNKAFENGLIDAAVTYPPFSTELMRKHDLNVVYSTEEDPGKIFDALVIKDTVNPETADTLWNIWFDTIELINADPQAFAQFIADITGEPLRNIMLELNGIKLLNKSENLALLQNERVIRDELRMACEAGGNDVVECKHFAEKLRIRHARAD